MNKYTFEVPYYKKLNRKNGKVVNSMLGMNWYFTEKSFSIARVKKHYHKLVRNQLEAFEGDKLGKYKVKYKLFYKSKSQDMMNIVAVIDKFVQDGIVEFGLVEDDNVQYCKRVVCEVVEQDKINPRVEVEVEEVE